MPIVGFGPTFDGPAYLSAAVGGAVLGLGIAALAAWRRWGLLLIAALTAAAYFLFGGALALPHTTIAGVIPTIDTLRLLAAGVITSWKQLLTTVAPVAASDGHLIVPFLLSLVASVATASLALRAAHPAWALLPAAGFLARADRVRDVAAGRARAAGPRLRGRRHGVARRAAGLGAVAGRRRRRRGDRGARRAWSLRRVLAGAGVIAIAAGAGVATSAFAAPDAPRYVLRDVIIPPFDIRQYPSPLQSFRAYVRDDAEKTLFTVSGLPEGARMRLGTMDAYNGMVYNVSDEGAGSSSAFTQIRSNMSADAEGTPATLRVEVGGLGGVWLPDAGAVTSVEFEGDRAEELRRAAHYNEGTGTAVVTARLREDDAYTLTTMIPAERSDESLEGVPFAPARDARPRRRARRARRHGLQGRGRGEHADRAGAGARDHALRGRVLQPRPRGPGALARRATAPSASPRSIGGQQMVGDDEQYAVTMALMAGELGIPARVVMGFYPEEDQAQDGVFAANGNSLHAWVEVAFEGVGWLPFDPTPPEDQIPNDQTTKPKADPKPQVLQPPPPVQEPVDLPPTVPEDREGEDEENPASAIIGLDPGDRRHLADRARRARGAVHRDRGAQGEAPPRAARGRARRRPHQRRLGRARRPRRRLRDARAPGATRTEDADAVGTAFEEPRVATLARRADVEVFGPTEPTKHDIEEFWRQVDEIVDRMRERSTFWERVRAGVSVRSLLAGTRFALPETSG